MESIATGTTVVALEMLIKLLAKETKSMTNVSQRVSGLKDDLEYINSFLKMAESINEKDDALKIWVKQVRDLAFETEDVVEEFLLLLTLPSHHFLRAQIFHLQNLRTRHLLSEKIKLISLKMKGIKERRETFSLPSTSHDHEYLGGHALRLDALFVQDTEVVGIDDSKSQLSTLLNVEDKNLFIVTVVGMGGVGKTTLVKKVYESRAVKESFDCRAWITVSQSFTISGLLRASLKSFKGELKEGSDGVEWLINTLNNYLQQKRYIIELDDIQCVDQPLGSDEMMFPEDQVIKRSRLIRLWVSEGFAEDKLVGYTREEVAEGYLIELVNRNMVQSVSKN
ncbi:disease resistance protein RPP13-like [Impatiens glandulifera]|uniref:disease resistance protein RPP13-like n=1 Tax=Impatiens glandulifera TaxID=253017 RepID=UPI001FB0E49C|nr:disease resistance protein RPP13-like [Impatiens glandulifera]